MGYLRSHLAQVLALDKLARSAVHAPLLFQTVACRVRRQRLGPPPDGKGKGGGSKGNLIPAHPVDPDATVACFMNYPSLSNADRLAHPVDPDATFASSIKLPTAFVKLAQQVPALPGGGGLDRCLSDYVPTSMVEGRSQNTTGTGTGPSTAQKPGTRRTSTNSCGWTSMGCQYHQEENSTTQMETGGATIVTTWSC